jgi:hypothetical protein
LKFFKARAADGDKQTTARVRRKLESRVQAVVFAHPIYSCHKQDTFWTAVKLASLEMAWTDSLGVEMVMKCLTALLAAVILLAGAGASDAVVRIARDGGGQIGTYVNKYQGVRSSGERVIVDGFCASACTIVLGSVPHDKICVTSRARFGFHAAWDSGYRGREITNPEATQALYFMYPFEVRRWIDQHGGLTAHMIFLSGRELAAMYRPCYLDSQISSH